MATTDTTRPGASVYWLRDGKVWPAARAVEGPRSSLRPSRSSSWARATEEEAELDATTAIPGGDPTLDDRRRRRAHPARKANISNEARAQIVYTLTQFPTVESVEIGGKSYTRADFEEQTPSVLVESPLPFEEVTSPLRATGTANTFEANFNYELVDSEGTSSTRTS